MIILFAFGYIFLIIVHFLDVYLAIISVAVWCDACYMFNKKMFNANEEAVYQTGKSVSCPVFISWELLDAWLGIKFLFYEIFGRLSYGESTNEDEGLRVGEHKEENLNIVQYAYLRYNLPQITSNFKFIFWSWSWDEKWAIPSLTNPNCSFPRPRNVLACETMWIIIQCLDHIQSQR